MRFPHVSQTTSSKYHCFLDCISVLSLSYFVIAVKIDQAKKWNIYWYVCFQFARCVYCLVLLKIKTFFDYTFLCCATCYSLLKPVGTSSTKKSKRCCKTKLCIRCSLLTMRQSRWTSFACCGTAFLWRRMRTLRLPFPFAANKGNVRHYVFPNFAKLEDSLYVLVAIFYLLPLLPDDLCLVLLH